MKSILFVMMMSGEHKANLWRSIWTKVSYILLYQMRCLWWPSIYLGRVFFVQRLKFSVQFWHWIEPFNLTDDDSFFIFIQIDSIPVRTSSYQHPRHCMLIPVLCYAFMLFLHVPNKLLALRRWKSLRHASFPSRFSILSFTCLCVGFSLVNLFVLLQSNFYGIAGQKNGSYCMMIQPWHGLR